MVVSGPHLDQRPRIKELGSDNDVPPGSGRWVEARHLREGDLLLSRESGPFAVATVTVGLAKLTVYNLHVRPSRAYAVGCGAWLAHNASPPEVSCNLASPVLPGPKPGRMFVEDGVLSDGTKYRDFVVTGRSTPELFSARLIDGQSTLHITWTETLSGSFLNRIRKVQKLAGENAFNRISGKASDTLRTLIESNRLDLKRAAKELERALGGTWKVDVSKQTSGAIFVTATRS